jgi:hypothetical protein
LARHVGQDVISAALLPLAGDGVIAAASAVILVASRKGDPPPAKARVILAAGIAATLAANLDAGLSGGLTNALLSLWAPVACIASMKLLAWLRAHTGMQPKRVTVASVVAPMPATPSASVDASPVASGTETPAELGNPPVKADLLTRAERAFPDGGKKMPPLRTI